MNKFFISDFTSLTSEMILFYYPFIPLQITKLKIDSNPFAKGFRDSSRLTDIER